MRQDRWFLAFVFVISFLLFYGFRTPFLGQWDSFSYMWQIIGHKPCTLAFGRPYYIGYNIICWELAKALFGLTVEQAGSVVQLITVLLGSLTLLVNFVFVRRLVNRSVAFLSTLLLLGSPLFIVYSGYIMTEVPMLFFLLSGLAVYLRGLDENKKYLLALGSSLVGVSIGVREQALFFLPLLVMLPLIQRQNLAGKGIKIFVITLFPAVIVASIGSLFLLLLNPAAYLYSLRYWLAKVPRQNVNLAGVKVVLFYLFINSPIAALLCIPGFISLFFRKQPFANPSPTPDLRPLAPDLRAFFFFATLIPLALLLPDGDLKLHPRYELSLVPGVTILAAVYVHRIFGRPGLHAALQYVVVGAASLLIVISAAGYINTYRVKQQEMRDLSEYLLKNVPTSAAFIPGQYTPIIDYYRQIGMRPNWQMVDSGWDWSRVRLLTQVNKFIKEGREVYLIKDRNAWLVLDHELKDLKGLGEEFDFLHVDDRLQRLQPKRTAGY